MQLRPLSREEVRSIDRIAAHDYGLPTLVLMENAGRGAAEWLRQLAPPAPSRIFIACGSGNNGGDGAVVARHLEVWGHEVRLRWFADMSRLSPDAAAQHAILDHAGLDQAFLPGTLDPGTLDSLLADSDWIVDALLGTGLTREVDGPLRHVIEALNRSGKPILSLDLPSGLDADRGLPLGLAVKAQATATFVAPKLGLVQPAAAPYRGQVRTIEIGVPRKLLLPFAMNRPDHQSAAHDPFPESK